MSKTISKTNPKYKKFRDFYEEEESPKRSKPRFQQESRKQKDWLRHELNKGNFSVVEELED